MDHKKKSGVNPETLGDENGGNVHSRNASGGIDAANDILESLGMEGNDADDDVKIFGTPTRTFTPKRAAEPKEAEKPKKKTESAIEFSLFEDDSDEEDAQEPMAVPNASFFGESPVTEGTLEEVAEIEEAEDEAEKTPEEESAEAEPVANDSISEELPDADVEVAQTEEESAEGSAQTAEIEAEVEEEIEAEATEETEAEAEAEAEAEEVESESESEEIEAEQAAENDDPLKRLFYGESSGEKVKEPKKKKKKAPKPEAEANAADLCDFTEIDMSDRKSVLDASRAYEKKRSSAFKALAGSMVFFLLVLYAELAPISGMLPHASIMSKENPAFYSLISLQLMLFGVMFLFDSLTKGIETFIDRRIVTPSAIALTVVAASGIQAILSAFSATAENLRLFCSVGAGALVMLALYDYLSASADKRSFDVASILKKKYGAKDLDKSSPDLAPFKDTVSLEGTKAVSIEGGRIYKRFAERTSSLPECEKKLWLPALIALCVAVLIGFISSVAAKSFYIGISNAVLVYISSVPINLFLSSSLPRHVAVKRGKSIKATMVGKNVGDEFKRLSLVNVPDTALFLVDGTVVESGIAASPEKYYHVVSVMIKIFRHIGGPLSKAFDRYLSSPSQEISADVKLLSVQPNVIEASVDGRVYRVATDKQLSSEGIAFKRAEGDERYSVLFLLEKDEILAKFRIDYKIDERFERAARCLDDAHISIGIKTVTPGITDGFLRLRNELDGCMFAVVKGSGEKDIPVVASETDSGVIAIDNVHKFLEMLLICENTVRKTRINGIIKYLSVITCLVMSSWLIISNASLPVVFALILQAFWLLPVVFNSYFQK